MLFNSFSFLIFFPIVVIAYYVIPKKLRHVWLLVCSCYFYMSWNPRYLLLILFSTVITYGCGLLIERAETVRKKKCYVGITILANLGVLLIFKYLGFVFEAVTDVLKVAGISAKVPTIDLLLPVGISFYTFQTIGYIIDVYRGKTEAEHSFISYALFVTFFPQLVAGPIERSSSLLSELKNIKTADLWDAQRNSKGFWLMLWGFFQKMVIADRVSILVDYVYANVEMYSGFVLVVAAVFFAVQIYCDFAGYTNIARGAAAILGVRLMNNFKQPYFAQSVKEFWGRWHISLSSWFKDYLYIPLGGSRKGELRKYINLLIVFLVSGLWHGAAYTYLFWGLLHGIYRVVEEVGSKLPRQLRSHLPSGGPVRSTCLDNADKSRIPDFFRMLVVFVLVDFAWIFFRAEDIGQALLFCKRMLLGGLNPWTLFDGTMYTLGLDAKDFWVAVIAIAILLIVDVMQYVGLDIYKIYRRQNVIIRTGAVYVFIFVILIWGIYGAGYDAAQFIYFQF